MRYERLEFYKKWNFKMKLIKLKIKLYRAKLHPINKQKHKNLEPLGPITTCVCISLCVSLFRFDLNNCLSLSTSLSGPLYFPSLSDSLYPFISLSKSLFLLLSLSAPLSFCALSLILFDSVYPFLSLSVSLSFSLFLLLSL